MLISIVIPSRDRVHYLRHSVATALAIPDSEIEVIVSDNASFDDTEEVIKSIKDKRLKYVNTGARLSMRANFEIALNACSGDYIIFFGDDDGIIPGQFADLRYILTQHKPDVLSWEFLTYGWPINGYGKKTGGLRFERDKLFGGVKQSIPNEYRGTILQANFDRNSLLPRLYHGAMSRNFLDSLVNKDGLYFCSRSPDLHISFRAAQKGGSFLRIDHPFSINGYSPASTGGGLQSQGQNAKRHGKDRRFLAESEADPIQDIIPLSKSLGLGFLSAVETIRHHFPKPELLPNYVRWYSWVLDDAAKKDSTTSAEIMKSAHDYATFSSTEAQLNQAIAAHKPIYRKLHNLKLKLKTKPFSFRVNTEIDGENTIFTATTVCDQILGNDIRDRLVQNKSRRSCWVTAKKRGKMFKREL